MNYVNLGIIYFSGTGNTKVLAEELGKNLNIKPVSIEENIDFEKFLDKLDRIVIMYPIYFSVPPIILRDFIKKYEKYFENKEIISIASQMIYSGDGGRVIEDFLPESSKLVDINHINMPNNIPNVPLLPVSPDFGNKNKTRKGLLKIKYIGNNIKNGIHRRRHSSNLAIKMGEFQRVGGLKNEKEKQKKVFVNNNCISCGICEKVCPVNNFHIEEKAVPEGHCVLCLRCENKCPTKSIHVLIDKDFKRQYKGPIV